MTSPSQQVGGPTSSAEEGPVVDEERIKETYEELGRRHMELDPNPIEHGPKRFNNNIARVRALLSRVEQIFLQNSQDLHWFKRAILRETSLYELDKRHLMVNDPKCRVGRSQGEREALADVQLRDQIEKIQALEAKAQDLEMMMIVIKAKRTDLKDIQGRMRDQMKLIEHDLGMGARWGRNAAPDLLSKTATDLDDMLEQVDKDGGWSMEEDALPEKVTPRVSSALEEDPQESVIEFDAGLLEESDDEGEEEDNDDDDDDDDEADEADAEFAETDIDSLIPTQGAKGTSPQGESTPHDVDDFLSNFNSDATEEDLEHRDVDGASIDDLIATLSDDA